MGSAWRNRIIGHGIQPAKEFLANPFNFRIHTQLQQTYVEASLDTIGWYDEVIKNVNTGHVIDGHLRIVLAMRRSEDEPVPFTDVDLTEVEELQALAEHDYLVGLAVPDGEILGELLAGIQSQDERVLELLAEMTELSSESVLRDVSDGEGTGRELGDVKKQIKPVLYAEDIAIFEKALEMTGEMNRGKALIQICEYYVTDQGSAKR